MSLSIGKKYVDEIWTDVLLMDACHVILGRPWLFDSRVMHDGYKNTYSFTHNNKKITLTHTQHAKNQPKAFPSKSGLKKSLWACPRSINT